jgi:hypothetical protein
MTTLHDLEQTAHEIVDENGEAMVVIPKAIWQAYLTELRQPLPLSHKEQMEMLWATWANEPQADDNFWQEFDQFLKENPVRLGNPDTFTADEGSDN